MSATGHLISLDKGHGPLFKVGMKFSASSGRFELFRVEYADGTTSDASQEAPSK